MKGIKNIRMKKNHINKHKIKNPYLINSQISDNILLILEDYLSKIENINIDDMTLREDLSLLGVISELFPLLENPKHYLEVCHTLLFKLRERIYKNEFNSISLYDGLCNLAVFLRILHEYSGCYNKLYSELLNLINYKLEKTLYIISEKERISFFDYDTICGLSGIANCLLTEAEKNQKMLNKIGEFFVYLGSEYSHNGETHINWTKLSKNNTIEDYLDFSISHGIAGPLIILSRLYQNRIIIPDQIKSIINITNEYDYISQKTGINIWSGKVTKNIYFDENIQVTSPREGWCYGTSSVSMALLEAAIVTKNKQLFQKAYSQLYSVTNMSIQEMQLSNEILCHGYSGMVALYRNLFDLYKDYRFKQKALELLNQTLICYSPESNFGFPSWDTTNHNGIILKRTCDKMDFLEGSAGIIMELSSWLKTNSKYETMLLIK